MIREIHLDKPKRAQYIRLIFVHLGVDRVVCGGIQFGIETKIISPNCHSGLRDA